MHAMLRLIFCADPLDERRPDAAYAAEVEAAYRLGLPYDLVSYEALVNEGDARRAVRRVPERASEQTALYRGWMLRPERYRALLREP